MFDRKHIGHNHVPLASTLSGLRSKPCTLVHRLIHTGCTGCAVAGLGRRIAIEILGAPDHHMTLQEPTRCPSTCSINTLGFRMYHTSESPSILDCGQFALRPRCSLNCSPHRSSTGPACLKWLLEHTHRVLTNL
jgi:hypothetical protein